MSGFMSPGYKNVIFISKYAREPEETEVSRMLVHVRRAERADLVKAEAVMRRVLESDLGGYQSQWHADLDDLAAAYFSDPRHALFVAYIGGALVGTAAIRPCRLRTPPNPEWLASRYNHPSVCQLVRVWVDAPARRCGVARQLVRYSAGWATQEAGYRTVYLHTDASASGAEPFWRSLPTVEIHDARPDPYHCVHFELDVEKLLVGAPSG
jgi:GNAT superfamily N-acetyltransferase